MLRNFAVVVYKFLVQKKNCIKINDTHRIKMPKKYGYVKFKSFERKMKPSFMIYEDFVTILVPEDNRKQNPEKSYTSKASKTCC